MNHPSHQTRLVTGRLPIGVYKHPLSYPIDKRLRQYKGSQDYYTIHYSTVKSLMFIVLSEFYGPDILQDAGYDAAKPHGQRSRKRRKEEVENVSHSTDEVEWQQLKQFLDPNPQLKGISHEGHHPNVRTLILVFTYTSLM